MIEWMDFISVVIAALVAACLLVTIFALALRIGDAEGRRRRLASVALYGVCAFVVLFGIFLIVPTLHTPFGL
jgi:predicted PurR-regulated permease PerM